MWWYCLFCTMSLQGQAFLFLQFCTSWFCAVAFQHPFPGVIVKVFGSINPMWSWEGLKSHEFDMRLSIPSLTFQCWAPKWDHEEKQAPHPLQPWHWGFDLFFPVSKSHSPESLGIKGQVRHQRFSYTDSAPWQPKNPPILQEDVLTNPGFLMPPDFNQPRVICTQSTAL